MQDKNNLNEQDDLIQGFFKVAKSQDDMTADELRDYNAPFGKKFWTKDVTFASAIALPVSLLRSSARLKKDTMNTVEALSMENREFVPLSDLAIHHTDTEEQVAAKLSQVDLRLGEPLKNYTAVLHPQYNLVEYVPRPQAILEKMNKPTFRENFVDSVKHIKKPLISTVLGGVALAGLQEGITRAPELYRSVFPKGKTASEIHEEFEKTANDSHLNNIIKEAFKDERK